MRNVLCFVSALALTLQFVAAQPMPMPGQREDPFEVEPEIWFAPQLRAAYVRFLQGVIQEDWEQAANLIADDQPHNARVKPIVLKQLKAMRSFERAAVAALGKDKGDFGFGLTDDALNRRLAAAKLGAIENFALSLPPDAGVEDEIWFVLQARVGLTPGNPSLPGQPFCRIDPNPRRAQLWLFEEALDSSHLAVFIAAADELKAGKWNARDALEASLRDRLRKSDQEQLNRMIDPPNVVKPEDEQAIRTVCRQWLQALSDGNAQALKADSVGSADKEAPTLDRWIDFIVALRAFTQQDSRFSKQPDMKALCQRTLARIEFSRAMSSQEEASLFAMDPDPLRALAEPAYAFGILGHVPEMCPVKKVDGKWKVAPLSSRLREVPEPEIVQVIKDLTQQAAEGKIKDARQLQFGIQMAMSQAQEAISQRKSREEKQKLDEFEKWAQSDEGKAAVAKLTSPDRRLELRLASSDDKPEGGEMMVGANGMPVTVERAIQLNAAAVKRAYPTQDQNGGLAIGVELTEDGSRQMARITSANLRRRLAIIVDGKLITAPTIQSVIRDRLIITGRFTEQEHARIIAALNVSQPATQPGGATTRPGATNPVQGIK